MIVVVKDECFLDLDDEESEWALENLLTAHREGKHLVIVNQRIARATLSRFDRRRSATLASIAESFPQSEALLRDAPLHVITGLERSRHAHSSSQNEKTSVYCHLHWFADSQAAQPAVLVGESVDDAVAYQLLCAAVARLMRFRVCFETRGGGGSSLADVIRHVFSDHRFMAVLADSDRRSAASSLGSTALSTRRTVMRHEQGNRAFVFLELLLRVREIENLLPIRVLESVPRNYAQHGAIQRLLALRDILPDGWWPYIDMKAGLHVKALRTLAAEHSTWRLVLECDAVRPIASACKCVSDCHCFVVPPLGDFLGVCVQIMRRLGAEQLSRSLAADERKELQSLLLTIAFVGCAPRLKRT